MTSPAKSLRTIKIIHTVIWAFFASHGSRILEGAFSMSGGLF